MTAATLTQSTMTTSDHLRGVRPSKWLVRATPLTSPEMCDNDLYRLLVAAGLRAGVVRVRRH